MDLLQLKMKKVKTFFDMNVLMDQNYTEKY